jgi:hypothetical protein
MTRMFLVFRNREQNSFEHWDYDKNDRTLPLCFLSAQTPPALQDLQPYALPHLSSPYPTYPCLASSGAPSGARKDVCPHLYENNHVARMLQTGPRILKCMGYMVFPAKPVRTHLKGGFEVASTLPTSFPLTQLCCWVTKFIFASVVHELHSACS